MKVRKNDGNTDKRKGVSTMLYSYETCIAIFKTDYQLRKEIEKGNIFKIEKGIYSDDEYESDIAIMKMKYPDAVFTLNSAFYFYGLTDTIPRIHYLETDKDASKIRDEKVKQIFDNHNSLNVGVTEMEYDGTMIKVFDRERLLIELVRNKKKLPFDYYKEIIGNYRRLVHELDVQAIHDYAVVLPKTNKVMEIIQMEVF